MAILLIGSTGNGKSTLGNFLVDPRDESLFEKQIFKTAQTNMPQTQNVSQAAFEDKRNKKVLTVIDTPGLNESDTHDLKHMIQIIKSLQNIEAIAACVLVVKFSSKIDAQYKATVQYYRKLLPSLFDRNVIIVMTDYATDERSEQLRKRQGIDVEQIKNNTLREIVESGSLDYDPFLFMIDCLPDGDEERKLNLAERDAILSKIASQTPLHIKALKVAKTAFLKAQDREKTKEYEGEITGYNARLQQANTKAKKGLEKTQKMQQEITEKSNELNSLCGQLSERDSSDLIEVSTWSINKKWKFFQFLTQTFHETSPFRLERVTKWTNGHCEWKNYKETEYGVEGRVEGEFMRGIYAGFSLQTFKRAKYAIEITGLNTRIQAAKNHKQLLVDHWNETKQYYKEYFDDIELLEQFIRERRVLVEALASDYLTLEEALDKLKPHAQLIQSML